MKVVDVNVLIYAVNRQARHHRAAVEWLDAALSDNEPIGFPWASVLAFLRITTSRHILESPLTLDQAYDVIAGWLGQPNALILDPAGTHLERVHALLESTGAAGNLVNDAHIAAIALQHKAEVVTFDNDFDRFVGVRRLTPT